MLLILNSLKSWTILHCSFTSCRPPSLQISKLKLITAGFVVKIHTKFLMVSLQLPSKTGAKFWLETSVWYLWTSDTFHKKKLWWPNSLRRMTELFCTASWKYLFSIKQRCHLMNILPSQFTQSHCSLCSKCKIDASFHALA